MILNNYLKNKQFNKLGLVIPPINQDNCGYYNLQQYEEDLYPIETRVNQETILNNLRNLLSLIYNNHIINYKISTYQLFGGDTFNNNLYFDILKVFYEYKEFLNEVTITAQTTCLDDNFIMIFNMEKQLFNNVNCALELSYITDTPIDEEKIQTCARLDIYHQTFITPTNVDHWISYYRKWKHAYKKYYNQSILPSIIETRNNDWEKEQIDTYANLLTYMIWDRFVMCHFSPTKLAKSLWSKENKILSQYSDPIMINNGMMQKMPCGIQDTLYIELNDLDIIPCYRAAYQELHIGHIDKEITEKSLEIGLDLWEMNASHLPKCSHCEFTNVCLHQCLGASYETYGEMFVPTVNTCKLQQTKIITLYQTYKKLGVIKAAKKLNLLSNELLQLFDYLDNIMFFGDKGVI